MKYVLESSKVSRKSTQGKYILIYVRYCGSQLILILYTQNTLGILNKINRSFSAQSSLMERSRATDKKILYVLNEATIASQQASKLYYRSKKTRRTRWTW